MTVALYTRVWGKLEILKLKKVDEFVKSGIFYFLRNYHVWVSL